MKIADFGVEMWLDENENDCVYHLSETCANTLHVKELLKLSGKQDEYIEKIKDIRLDYGDITGSDRLKSGIAKMYRTLSPENITAAHGGIGANALLLLTLIEPGDHVISFLPTYQQLYSLPESIGARVDLITLKEENGWQIDADEFEKLVTDETKAICLNNPNNPTGTLIPRKTMERIVDIARKHDAYIICDEAYRGLQHFGEFLAPSIADLYEKGISTGSMSKAFSLAGIRFGWIAGPSELITKINKHRDYHVISIGKIDDLLACIALENRDAIFAKNRSICLENLDCIQKWIEKELRFSFVKPESSTTCFIKFDLDMDSVELCTRLLEETGTLLVPGRCFGFDDHFRLGFGNNKTLIEGGLSAFSQWLRKNGY